MADQTFEAFVASERARISGEREKIIAQRSELDGQLAALDKELAAIEAYESVKTGRTPAASTPRASASGGTGTRRTGQREAVLNVIKENTDGISAAKVLEAMGAESDSDKTSVRNALSALKKNGSVGLKNGLYVPA